MVTYIFSIVKILGCTIAKMKREHVLLRFLTAMAVLMAMARTDSVCNPASFTVY